MSLDNKNDFYICKIDSLRVTYYSFLSKCELEGYEEVTSYFNDMLEKKKNKKWIWIIDGLHYKIINGNANSYIDISCIKKLVQILSNNLSSLENIVIINLTSSLKQILAIIHPFLGEQLKKKIIYN